MFCKTQRRQGCTILWGVNPFTSCIQAANYLNIEGLLDLTTQAIADNIKGKKPQEIREIFNIKNEFTPEDEERVREENSWAFEWCHSSLQEPGSGAQFLMVDPVVYNCK